MVDGEQRLALKTVELCRGYAIQASFRWVSGQILILPNKAVLLWSDLPSDGRKMTARSLTRTLLATAFATLVGVVLVVISNAILMLPVGLALKALGGSASLIALVAISITGFRLALTGWRASQAYALERRRETLMSSGPGPARRRIDLMGARDRGKGHGGLLLDHFVRECDEVGATIFLVTEPHNERFYRRHGLRRLSVATLPAIKGMVLMRRERPQRAPVALPRQERHAPSSTSPARQPGAEASPYPQ